MPPNLEKDISHNLNWKFKSSKKIVVTVAITDCAEIVARSVQGQHEKLWLGWTTRI